MAQITTGIRGILSLPSAYDVFQNLLGARRSRQQICRDHVDAAAGDVVIDVGCGTAAILDHLPSGVRYYGFDLSQAYIDAARKSYGGRGEFTCQDITTLPPGDLPPCNIAIAIGLLHHLDDADARGLIESLHRLLAPGGKLVTVDPAYWTPQSPLARFMIARDRGQNVREGSAYEALVPDTYTRVVLSRRDDLLNIPYSHAVLECTK